jgi:Protein of unknown function (DUF3551)
MLLAAALSIMPALAMSATSAQADQWCGYAARAKSLIECGYSTVAECENAIGKGGMCFVDPEVVFNDERAAPEIAIKALIRRS